MKGRPRKPNERHKLEGTYRPDRHDDSGVDAPKGRPEPTIELDVFAQAMWDRLIPVLEGMGVLTLADAQICTSFCVAYSDWRTCREHIREYGMWELTEKRGTVKHPAVLIAKESDERMNKLGGQMGLSPSERSRLKVETEKEVDSFALAAFGKRDKPGKPDLKAVNGGKKDA